MVFPFLCVDLSLSEQLEHLSAAAHLALVLYNLKGPEFIPTNLFLDLLLMIKNAFFCVAKSKIDNPDGLFWIMLLGTDRLEIVFGILRTMIGNDANMDMLQLVSRLSGCTEVANILAKYPQWDRSPRRLKVPAISRDSKELPDAADHINPASWRGNVEVKNVSLQTSWRRGRRLVETECPFTTPILQSLEKDPDVNIFSPRGIFLINKPLGHDDVDESLIFPENAEPTSSSTRDSNADARLEVENALGQAISEDDPTEKRKSAPPVARTIIVKGKEIDKSRLLAKYSKYRKNVSSTDRLWRVQDVERYVQNSTPFETSDLDDSEPTQDGRVMSYLTQSQRSYALTASSGCALALSIVSESMGNLPTSISLDLLQEDTVSISYQLLGLRPATSEDVDEQTKNHDWRSYAISEHTFTVPGRLVQSINPEVSTSTTHHPYFLLESTVLVAIAASLLQSIVASDLKLAPKLAPSTEFPYREVGGKFSNCIYNDGNTDLIKCGTKAKHAFYARTTGTLLKSEHRIRPFVQFALPKSHWTCPKVSVSLNTLAVMFYSTQRSIEQRTLVVYVSDQHLYASSTLRRGKGHAAAQKSTKGVR
jgi:hypothetical protein